MRDLLLGTIIFAICIVALRRPWVGLLGWTWISLMEEIQGRTTDFVVAANGTIMHGLAVVYPIRDIPGIASFKVVQETLQRVVVQIVPGDNCGPEVETLISTGIKARLGQSVNVEVLRVSDIPRGKSGKYRYIVSHVAQLG